MPLHLPIRKHIRKCRCIVSVRVVVLERRIVSIAPSVRVRVRISNGVDLDGDVGGGGDVG